MMRIPALLITMILLFHSDMASAYNPFWTRKDKKLISDLLLVDKKNGREVERFILLHLDSASRVKNDLGFGWKSWTPGIGGGYVSVGAEFYYYHDSIVSYALVPQLPEEKGLIARYRKWFGDHFEYRHDSIQPFWVNKERLYEPLAEYNGGKSLPARFSSYMSPHSGLMFGYADGGSILSNRKAFLAIRDELGYEQLKQIMFSINPASRLTAIELYLRNRILLGSDPVFDNWINRVFTETPQVETMLGCEVVTEPVTSLNAWFFLFSNDPYVGQPFSGASQPLLTTTLLPCIW